MRTKRRRNDKNILQNRFILKNKRNQGLLAPHERGKKERFINLGWF